jgi:hypothetical protein
MCSDVQHFGGIWAGSVTDIVKILRRQSWHILWLHASFAVLIIGTSSEPQVRQFTFFKLICVVGVLRSKLDNKPDPFLACDSAIEGTVLDRVGVSFVASDLERTVVGLRWREGRDACGLRLEDMFLL